jgi:3-keto-disaccharide hydrolase
MWRFFLVIVAMSAILMAGNEGRSADPPKTGTADAKPADVEPATAKKDAAKPRSLFDGKTLSGWKASGFGAQGKVEVKDERIVIGFGEGCSGVTYTGDVPKTDYEITLEAMRVDGTDFFCGLTFPVERDKKKVQPCTLVLGGWGGGTVGLSSIDGYDASENSTSSYKEFENGRWYKVRLRVTKPKIEAWIDKDKVVDFTIGQRDLSIRIEVEESKPLGIATWRTTGAVRKIEIRPVTEPDSPPEKE